MGQDGRRWRSDDGWDGWRAKTRRPRCKDCKDRQAQADRAESSALDSGRRRRQRETTEETRARAPRQCGRRAHLGVRVQAGAQHVERRQEVAHKADPEGRVTRGAELRREVRKARRVVARLHAAPRRRQAREQHLDEGGRRDGTVLHGGRHEPRTASRRRSERQRGPKERAQGRLKNAGITVAGLSPARSSISLFF